MLKVLIVALSEAERPRGVERYAIEVINRMARTHKIKLTVVVGRWQRYLFDIEGVDYIFYDAGNSKLARHAYLAFKVPIIASEFQVAHYLNSMPVFFRGAHRTFITIHDVAEYKLPEKYPFIQRIYRKIVTFAAAHVANGVITVSETSKADIAEVLRVNPAKIYCFLNGINHFQYPVNVLNEIVTHDPYICYFGPIEQGKGIELLVEAFINAKDSGALSKEIKLFFAGVMNEGYRVRFESLMTTRVDVQYSGYLNKEDVPAFLSEAKLVAYPALYEGFGFPILEAFMYNDNVLCSSTGALGEIGRDFCWLVNPYSAQEFAGTLQQAILSPKAFDENFKKNLLARYDWQAVGDGLISKYLE